VRFAIEHRAYHIEPELWVGGTRACRFRRDFVCGAPTRRISPMKNQMNDIWDPIKANGVNYYMFAGPQTWTTSYSERSNPLSPGVDPF
jgi:hypothetical protein